MTKKYLIFIDTNKYLDFYRSDTEAVLTLLKSLDRIRNRIIVTYQVEMEFKKNRQNVIIKALSEIQPSNKIFFPAFLTGTQDVERIKKYLSDIKRITDKMKQNLRKILSEPSVSDEVYKCCQKIFTTKSDINLRKEDKKSRAIQILARKRFLLGYPPRKEKDTSMGDSINWEWILSCALEKGADIVLVVSRDNDYGISEGGQSFLNDFLGEEFKRRTKGKAKIILTNNLSEGLKKLSIIVPKKAAKAEKQLIKDEENVSRKQEEYWKYLRNYLVHSTTSSTSSSSSIYPYTSSGYSGYSSYSSSSP